MPTTGNIREVAEGLQYCGPGEALAWTLDTSNWANTPTSVTMTVVEWPSKVDVTNTVTSGSIVVSGDTITLKTISGLTLGKRYRAELSFTAGGGSPFQPFLEIECK